MTDAIARGSYEDVSQCYQLIDDRCVQVIVPYEGRQELFEEIQQELQRTQCVTPQLLQRAAPITVSVYDRDSCERFAEPLFLPARRGSRRAQADIAFCGRSMRSYIQKKWGCNGRKRKKMASFFEKGLDKP